MEASKWSARAKALRAAPADSGPCRVQMSLRLPPDVIAEIAEMARRERRSRTAMVELLLVEAIASREAKNEASSEVFG